MTEYKALRLLTVMFIALSMLSALAACGVKGSPQPRQASRSFVWQEVTITPVKDCLTVNAMMSGVYRNLDSVVLELAAVNGEEDCPGCPFLATERHEIKELGKIFDPNHGTLSFTYCPRESAVWYRARLIGMNIFDSTRHEISPEQRVVMPLDMP